MTKILAGVLIASSLFAQEAVRRPKILGVAHMAVYVKDLAKARQFYEDFMGFGEPFTLPKKGGEPGVRIAFVKVNDHQYMEIFNEADRGEATTKAAPTGSLLYCGLVIRWRCPMRTLARLPVGDTAGCQPALRGRLG